MELSTIETDPQSPFCDYEVPAAEWTWRHVVADACAKGPAYLRAWCAKAGAAQIPDFPSRPSGQTVEAFVNHGRWMWKCRTCPDAQVASHEDRRAFCTSCFNQGSGWHEVIWPDDETLVRIDRLLGRRPLHNRNWIPGETIDNLQIDNVTIGVDPNLPGLPTHRYTPAVTLVRNTIDSRRPPELTYAAH